MRNTRQRRPAARASAAAQPGAWRGIAGIAAALLAILVYANALDNPFVYDDYDTILANTSLADPTNVWFVLLYSPFRPVVNVSYAFDRAVWGLQPFGFHLTNVLLHAMVVFLLYHFLLRALADARQRRWTSLGAPPPAEAVENAAAFGAASLFAVHPLMSEVAGYISGRSESICAVFFLASVLLARRAIVHEAGRVWSIAGATVCGVLALMSKEAAAGLPLVLLAYDWLVLPGTAAGRRRRLLFVFLPVMLLIAAAGVWRVSILLATGAGGTHPALLTALTQAIVLWRYIGLLVAPVGQSIMHSYHAVTSVSDPLALAAVAGLLALVAAGWALRRIEPLVLFGVIWFLLVIAPSSSIVALREGMAEHRAYLASAGLFAALSAGIARLVAARARRRQRLPVSTGMLHAAIVAVCIVLTLGRNAVWGSPVRLWREATVRAAGMWEPHYALADALRESGDCAAAVEEYKTVVRMRPGHRDGYVNLGICLGEVGRLGEAEHAFKRAIHIDPSFARGYTNLGALALLSGDPEKAKNRYLEALEVEPRNVIARMQLARLYETTFHDYHAAARMCGEARAIAPTTPGVVECVQRNQKLAAAADANR